MKKQWSGIVIKLKDHKTTVFVVIGIIGILLILVSELFSTKGNSKERAVTEISEDKYIEKLESRLKELVQNIEGAGSCDVMITLENGEESVYAVEQKINTDQSTDNSGSVETSSDLQRTTEDKYILMQNSDGSEDPLLIKQIQPTVKGVVVLSEGGNKILVQQRIIDCITTALNLSSNRICVIQKSR